MSQTNSKINQNSITEMKQIQNQNKEDQNSKLSQKETQNQNSDKMNVDSLNSTTNISNTSLPVESYSENQEVQLKNIEIKNEEGELNIQSAPLSNLSMFVDENISDDDECEIIENKNLSSSVTGKAAHHLAQPDDKTLVSTTIFSDSKQRSTKKPSEQSANLNLLNNETLESENVDEEKTQNLKIKESQFENKTSEILSDVEPVTTAISRSPSQENEIGFEETHKPAKEFPFQLDDFQQKAIMCLEKNENVLVTAHTSAGKTVVAEYAIAKALKNKQRVIYTSPIKALSNQKYSEFLNEFDEDVGLLTGDVNKNSSAGCLVMTTEILRNMLYHGNILLSDVAFVIFDEVHYMRDRERGVVQEESIILLDRNITLVFLSATLSNSDDFASQVAHLKQRPCHVISTDVRPVPLQHYIFPLGGSGIYLIKDGEKPFNSKNFEHSIACFSENRSFSNQYNNRFKANHQNQLTDFKRLIKLLTLKGFDPVICFCFSRRETEGYALETSDLDFNTEEEKQMVDVIFQNAVACLTERDRNIPQISSMLPLLRKGIGVHHSGLLLILKEITEILFQESLIKVLFATETFSMGVNMPAKTVVFASYQKFDGKDYRNITSGEYTQMSGRAGRRGKDDRGICIMMTNEGLNSDTFQQIISGVPDPMVSSFTLSYPMVLNLMNSEILNPEQVIDKSFHQFEYARIDKLREMELQSLSNEIEKFSRYSDKEMPDIAKFYNINEMISDLNDNLQKTFVQPKYLIKYLQPGRLVYLEVNNAQIENKKQFKKDLPNGSGVQGQGIVCSYRKRFEPDKYVVDILVRCKNIESFGKIKMPLCLDEDLSSFAEKRHVHLSSLYEVVRFSLESICFVSSIRLYMPEDILTQKSRRYLFRKLNDIQKRYANEAHKLPLIDFSNYTSSETDVNLDSKTNKDKDLDLDETMCEKQNNSNKIESLKKLRESIKTVKELPSRKRENYLNCHAKWKYYKDKMTSLRLKATKKSHTELFLSELRSRMTVLRRLGYVDDNNIVQLKGRVASFIESVDALVLTELIFDGIFRDLTGSECVAILSCLLEHEKSKRKNMVELTPRLKELYQHIVERAKLVSQVIEDSKIEIDKEKFVEAFDSNIMVTCHAQCEGYEFTHVCKLTDLFEGSIVRLIRRIQELLLNLVEAAKSIGNDELKTKFSDAIASIKRGIAFSSSLYFD